MGLAEQRLIVQHLDFREIVAEAVEAHQADIVEYQKGQQLQGLTATGERIGKYKNPDYARKKANMNPLAGYGNVDLKLTGEFHRNIKVRFFSETFQVFSTDNKAADLEEKYGPDIWGLNAEFINDFRQVYLNNDIANRIVNKIYGL